MRRATITTFLTLSGLTGLQSLHADQSEQSASPSSETSQAIILDDSTVRLLGIHLLGTVLPNDPTAGAVVAEDVTTGEQHIYQLGDPFYGGILQAINRGRITVAVGDQRYILDLPEGPVVGSGLLPESDHRVEQPTRSVRPRIPHSFALLPLRPGSLEPYVEGGVVTGALIRKLPAIGARRLGGFKRGDIIRRVDGQPITSADMVQQLPERLRQHTLTNFEVQRQSQRLELVFHR